MPPTATPDFVMETLRSATPSRGRAAADEACLIHIYPSGPLIGRRYVIEELPLLIGRNEDCQVRNMDASVSRHHARIECCGGIYTVTDLGSTNGTFVNNVVTPRGVLQDGDYLRIGNCIYRFLASGNVEAEYHEEIYRMAIVDGLTGVPNRRRFAEFLDREVAHAVRHRRELALAIMDIDHFKQVNDKFGHVAGDTVLRKVAAEATAAVREDELFARYGGEEFALVMPEATVEQAVEACERLRVAMAAQVFEFDAHRCKVTVSFGVALLSEETTPTAEGLIRAADTQLYRAKRAGRNLVCTASRPTPAPPASGQADRATQPFRFLDRAR